MNSENEIKQFNILQIIFYHLLPGIPVLLIAMLCASPTWGGGLPMGLALMISFTLGVIPTQLIILKSAACKDGMKIKDILCYMEKMPASRILLWVIPSLVIAAVVFATVSNIEESIWAIFNWVPDWFRVSLDHFDNASRGMIRLTVMLGIVFNGLLVPFVEELYFRGFLLPRMNLFGKLAPLASTVLFSMYHLFSPWETITRILGDSPYVYAVWHKKNIWIGICAHCGMNTLSMIGVAILLLS